MVTKYRKAVRDPYANPEAGARQLARLRAMLRQIALENA